MSRISTIIPISLFAFKYIVINFNKPKSKVGTLKC